MRVWTSSFYKNWTPTRKAKFVDYRLRGMHTEWAVFWTMVNRANSDDRLYKAAEVESYLERGGHPRDVWGREMCGNDRNLHLPPKELFDVIGETTT